MHTNPVQVKDAGTFLTYSQRPVLLSAFIPNPRRNHVALRWPGTLRPEAVAWLFDRVTRSIKREERPWIRVWYEDRGDPLVQRLRFEDVHRLASVLADVDRSPFVRVEAMEDARHGAPDVVVWKNQMTTQPAGLGESNEAVGVEIPQDSLEDVLDPITDALSDTYLPEEIGFRDREAIHQRLRDVLSDLRELRTRRRH